MRNMKKHEHRPEIVKYLQDLANEFEKVVDQEGNDWMLFIYQVEPPWFIGRSDSGRVSERPMNQGGFPVTNTGPKSSSTCKISQTSSRRSLTKKATTGCCSSIR